MASVETALAAVDLGIDLLQMGHFHASCYPYGERLQLILTGPIRILLNEGQPS
jgi:hypothetical protein